MSQERSNKVRRQMNGVQKVGRKHTKRRIVKDIILVRYGLVSCMTESINKKKPVCKYTTF